MQRGLTIAQQFLALRTNPICAGSGKLQRARLTWRFDVRPSAFGRTYKARIEYGPHAPAEVFIDTPDLHALADGRALPHVYEDRPPKLCLYLPGTSEWGRHLRLDQTVVPWTALWLFYFEEWLWSNDWKGGGVHPGDSDAPRVRRRRAGR